MMLPAQSPSSQAQLIQTLKNSRIPLQPRNHSNIAINSNPNPPSQKQRLCDIIDSSSNDNKENVPPSPPPALTYSTTPVKDELFQIDGSLADELTAIREKMERVRADRDNTDKLLTGRAATLDLQMKEIFSRWETQKLLEMELDRLYRLQEIRLACLRVSPLRSLREKEHEKKINQSKATFV